MKSHILFTASIVAVVLFTSIKLISSGGTCNTVYVFPSGSSYETEWKKVDSLKFKGLTKSALEIVLGIYDKAKADDNAPQLVKAVIYRSQFENNVEHDAYVKIIEEIKHDIATCGVNVRPVLHSILADMYWRYYEINRYKFMNRTETLGFKEDDIKTWDLKKLVAEVTSNYEQSLENKEQLQKVQIDNYDDILIKGYHTENLRPTLYDFLAHRALDFYINEEALLSKPAYRFEINSNDYFLPYTDFARLNIITKDSSSFDYHALLLMQNLLNFHKNDKDPAALVDVDIKRINFVYNNSVSDKKKTLYEQALRDLEKRFINNPASADVSFQLAAYYEKESNDKKDSNSSDHQDKSLKKRAFAICDSITTRFPNTVAASDADYLKGQIKAKSLAFTVEKVNTPNAPFRSLISYKNVTKTYLRVCKVDRQDYKNEYGKYYEDKFIKYLIKLPYIKSWSVDLPDDGDYYSHSTEIKVDDLPVGEYVILAATDSSFKYTKNAIAYGVTYISNLTYITRRKDDGSTDFNVFNKTSGAPVVNASIQLWYEDYSYILREYLYVKGARYTTNADGYFEIPPMKEYRNYNVEITYHNDDLFTDDGFYQYAQYKPDTSKRLKTYFFTDRSIYRPGQTIYYKGIMLETDGETTVIKPNVSSTVYFYDVNYQQIATTTLTSNDYGTFSGTFTAPQGVLNGNMSINNGFGSLGFSVEDYKRPKFEVIFQPIKGSFKLNENVPVKGLAKAFSGNVVDHAKVTYRVERTANFPYWWYYWGGYYPNSPKMEITNGTAETDDNGEFEINFKAIPDLSLSKDMEPTFNYSVEADVTDQNGETHSETQIVRIGYTALTLDINIPNEFNKEQYKEYKITTNNLAGEKEPSTGKINIYLLHQPERILRDRKWNKPDKFIYTEEEYHASFPNDIYNDENQISKWKKEKKVAEVEFNTLTDSMLHLDKIPSNVKGNNYVLLEPLSQWSAGKYVIEMTSKDKFGEDVKTIKYFTLSSTKEKTTPVNDVLWFSLLKDKAEPGDKISFLVGSKDTNVSVLYEIERKKKIISKQWLNLSNEQKLIEIPITEEDRGNLSFHLTTIRRGRVYQEAAVITVPYTNKELDISFETFRDKLYPGQKEEWKIKIKGKNGEKVAAEMVAAMYDASLDKFRAHSWDFSLYTSYYASLYWQANTVFEIANSQLFERDWNIYPQMIPESYDRLNWFGFEYYGYSRNRYYSNSLKGDNFAEGGDFAGATEVDQTITTSSIPSKKGKAEYKNAEITDTPADEGPQGGVSSHTGFDGKDKDKGIATGGKGGGGQDEGGRHEAGMSDIKGRSNFAETAFFFPHLETNEQGEVIISFTVPEALTKWKIMGLAHTKDLKYAQIEKELVTQKDLMIMPNPPRFLREGDHITIFANVSNLTENDMTNGTAQLFLYDALTMKPIDIPLNNSNPIKSFEAKKGQSASLGWDIFIPDGTEAVTYKVVAKSGNFTDGEEQTIPVLTNRMLVTESLPLPMRGNQTRTFIFSKLLNSGNSTTLKNHKLTLEFTSNPAWYAIQALPYLIEYPYECTEQTFSRYYANTIASHIANSNPKIKAVFDSWKNKSPEALLSNLEKNQELKSLMLEETPWVLNAKDESERKKRVGLLFDLNRMANEMGTALRKLQNMQTSNGGFAWWKGMPDDRYITQHIMAGFGHLDHLGCKEVRSDNKIWTMITRAIPYLDDRIREDYDDLIKYKVDLTKNHLSYIQIHYLYVRSYFKDIKISSNNQKAFDYYKGQAQKYWLENSRYMQGMISLALYRYAVPNLPQDIIKSLKENSIHSEELGMYWKDMDGGYYWYQAPIETQALLIEAFDEVGKDKDAVEEMKLWLLKQKQTQDWGNTKATVEACYALLLRGADMLASDKLVDVTVGSEKIEPRKRDDVKVEAGTGYFKTSWSGGDIKPDMGTITVTKSDSGAAWGAIYWQYFEQLDKITPHETPLKLNKKLFLQRNSDTGPIISPVDENTILKPGDLLKVRIEIRVDRDMEYVHMKDMRASGLEPEDVISTYKYQDGLGYYQSTRDAATNFFFSWLPRGTYVFEYPLRVAQSGDFSNGITTIQCMYAPEFTSHSEGIRIKVGK